MASERMYVNVRYAAYRVRFSSVHMKPSHEDWMPRDRKNKAAPVRGSLALMTYRKYKVLPNWRVRTAFRNAPSSSRKLLLSHAISISHCSQH